MTWTDPRTWVAGEDLTAALLNTHLRDNLKAIGDAWASYTPTLGSWTLSNGTLVGEYLQAGKLIIGTLTYTVGSGDTKSSSPTFSLPATAAQGAGMPIGNAGLFDTSGSARAFRTAFLATTSTFVLSAEDDTRISPTAPWTWATGDKFFVSFTYEAA